jgi:hypothetical protein
VFLLGELNKEKSPALSRQGFFFVDKRFEISNLELIKDMDKIIKLEEVLSMFIVIDPIIR